MKRHSGSRRSKQGIQAWKLCLLVVLVVLLVAVSGLAFWLSRETAAPPGTEMLQSETPAIPSADQSDPMETGSFAGTEEPEAIETEDTPQDTQLPEIQPPQEETNPPAQNNGGGTSSGSSGGSGGAQKPEEPVQVIDSGIICKQYGLFSGQYVEDGRDEQVSNVAAILVSNNTEQFLDLATIVYEIDGEKATFIVTGLPAGRSAWIMEANRMTVSSLSVFRYKGITTSFRDGVVATADEVTITADGNMLTAVNNTGKTLNSVFVYYRTLHTDGNFFGGITYLVDFGTLEPGASVTKMGGHFSENSEIVRVGWNTQ